jgi:hypothetical protein
MVGWLALVVTGVTALARPARAYSLELEWDAPRACPDLGDLHLAVERLLGETLLEGAASRAVARVTQDDDGRFTLALAIRTPDGEGKRDVRTDSCANALDIAAFAIALALNPELRVDGPTSGRTSNAPAAALAASPRSTRASSDFESTGTTAPSAGSTALVARLDSDRSREPEPGVVLPPNERNRGGASRAPHAPEVWLGAHALLDSSFLPTPALGMSITAELRIGGWMRLGVRPALFLPQEDELESGAGGRFTLWSAEVYGCAAFGAMAVCPLFQYGVLHGTGRNVVPTLEQSSRIYAPGAALLGSLGVTRSTEARLGLAGLFPLSRDVFTVQDGKVHEVPSVSLEVSLGAATRAF